MPRKNALRDLLGEEGSKQRKAAKVKAKEKEEKETGEEKNFFETLEAVWPYIKEPAFDGASYSRSITWKLDPPEGLSVGDCAHPQRLM